MGAGAAGSLTGTAELFGFWVFPDCTFLDISIFYGYFGILSLANVTLIFTFTAFNRYGCWLRKDATFATYGLFGLIGMDWLALLLVVVSDIVIGMIVVESMLWKIKKVPISLGVLQ